MDKSEPAFPCERRVETDMGYDTVKFNGLTKREYFAAMAMQGLIAGGMNTPVYMCTMSAVVFADALIEELNK